MPAWFAMKMVWRAFPAGSFHTARAMLEARGLCW